MADDAHPKPTFSVLGRWAIAFNVFIGLVAALALAVMANYLSSRHYWRWPLALQLKTKLSPQTARVLHSVTNDVKVTLFFDTQDTDDNRETVELYNLVSGLLREYNYCNPKIVVRTVDPTRRPADAAALLATYRLNALTNRDFVVLDCESRAKIIYKSELADYKWEVISPDRPDVVRKKLAAFRGEVALTEGIFNLVNPRRFKICFTQGHGEHDPEDASSIPGYGKFAQALKEKTNGEWEKLWLRGTNDIPGDCQLLIVAGAYQPFTDAELAKIESFLKRGGRLFAPLRDALGGPTGLERMLANWNVDVGDKAVADVKTSPRQGYEDLVTYRLNPDHPVTKALLSDSQDLGLWLILPRRVGPLRLNSNAPDAPRLEVLASTSENGLEIAEMRGKTPYPNPMLDRKGRFPLVVAVEQGNIKNVIADRGATRIIVLGDSLCLDNELIDQPCGNHYFGTLAVNWLLDRPQLLFEGLVPQPLRSNQLVMTTNQFQTAQLVLLGGLPGVTLLFGALVWWRRRH